MLFLNLPLRLEKLRRASLKRLLQLSLVLEDVSVHRCDLLWINSLTWVKLKFLFSLAPPFYEFLGHCRAKPWYCTNFLLRDVGGGFNPVALECRLPSRAYARDVGVLDEEVAEELLELLSLAIIIEFLNAPLTPPGQRIPFFAQRFELFLLLPELTYRTKIGSTEIDVALVGSFMLRLRSHQSRIKRRERLLVGEPGDQ